MKHGDSNLGQKVSGFAQPGISTALLAEPWFKTCSIATFMTLFFVGYFYLLRHPAYAVGTIPATWLDDRIGFQPAAFAIYVSLWPYTILPPALLLRRRDIVDYGLRMGALCAAGFAVFHFWPNRIAALAIDWERYPSVAFLKEVDTSGNACPSLHVATAVFTAIWLHSRIATWRRGALLQVVNAAWCVAIAWSTLAIKQHVALDVYAGAALGASCAWATGLGAHARR